MRDLKPREYTTNLFIIFVLWPLAALFESLLNYRSSWAKNGIWLFIIFFGYTFVSQEGQDSSRYILHFQEFHRSDADFSVLYKILFSEGSRYIDIFQPIITLLVAKFTGDYRVLFAVYGFIFGFFYSRNIDYLLRKTKGKLNPYLRIFLVVFALLVPIWFINGFRFWTAAHIFIFGALPYLLDGKKSGIWISVLSVLMHFSFIFPLVILGIYRIVGNKTTLFLIFFIVSSFISEINIPVIKQILISYTPEIIHDRINDYTNEAYIDKLISRQSEINWYVIWYRKGLGIALNILLVIVFFKGREIWKKRKEMLKLFSFLLLFGGLANIFGQIPSVGRFVAVFNLFAASFLFLYFSLNGKELLSKRIFWLLTPAFGLFFIVSFRVGFDNIGLYALVSNPLLAPFLNNGIALIDLIK